MSNGQNNSNRLDRIENALDRLIGGLEETKAIVNSNSRAIQAATASIEATSDNLDKLSNQWQETKQIVNSNSRAIEATSDNLDKLSNQWQETKQIVNSNSRAIEATSDNLDKLSNQWQETKQIANSNSRAIQAMMEQQATDRLKHEEAMAQMREMNANHSQRLSVLENISSRLTEVQSGMARMLVNHDEDRPTILRRLMTIENKVDRILEQGQE